LEYYPEISKDFVTDSQNLINVNKIKWDKPFFIDTNTYIDIDKIQEVVNQFDLDNIKNIIVLGTGGSIQTLLALKHLSKKKIFPVVNSRAVELKGCLDKTNPENSIVIPISRGGETLDVNSTIGIFRKEGYKFLGLSSKGTMKEILINNNFPILDVPDLSGRYAGSISNVGIVPAYAAGINIDNFIRGLKEGYQLYISDNQNQAIILASYFYYLTMRGYKIIFSMPYSKNLEGSIGLFVQEISESTGKDEKGLMGAYQSAPLCQHSVLEYLLGGTRGVVIPILWTTEREISDFSLPSSIEYVNGLTAQTVVNFQANATFQALIEQNIPSTKVALNIPDEFGIGKLIAFIQSTVYYLCLLLDVNWANNPKVVIGKKICNDALINKLSNDKWKEIRRKLARDKFKDF